MGRLGAEWVESHEKVGRPHPQVGAQGVTRCDHRPGIILATRLGKGRPDWKAKEFLQLGEMPALAQR